MKKCENIVNLLEGYLAGELTDALRAEVEAHLAGCDSCRRELRLWEALRQTPSVPAPAILHRNVMERLKAEEARPKASLSNQIMNFFRFRFFVWGAATAVALFALIIGVHLWRSPNQTEYSLRRKIAPQASRPPARKPERAIATAFEAYSINQPREEELHKVAEGTLIRDADRATSRDAAHGADSALNILNQFNASNIERIQKVEEPAETFYTLEMSVEDFDKFEAAIKNTNIRIVNQQMIVANADADSAAKVYQGTDKDLYYQTKEEYRQAGDVWRTKDVADLRDGDKYISLKSRKTTIAAESAPAAPVLSASKASPTSAPQPSTDAPALSPATAPAAARVHENIPSLGGAAGLLSRQSASDLKAAGIQVADEITTPIISGDELKSKIIQESPSRKSDSNRYYQVEIGIRNQP